MEKTKTCLKYFNNQKHYSSNKAFTDISFPPDIDSILGKNVNDQVKDAYKYSTDYQEVIYNTSWRRLSDLFPTSNLFDSENEVKIVQGSLGDCYFISVLIGLSNNPFWIKRLFSTQAVSGKGYYEVRLFIAGEWQKVIIDDFIPVVEEEPIFLSVAGNCLWPFLLQKAWAKVNRGYLNSEEGLSSESFTAITGLMTETIYSVNYDRNLFSRIVKLFKEHSFSLASSATEKGVEKANLHTGHEYLLVDAFTVKKENGFLKMLQIRNPNGLINLSATFVTDKFHLIEGDMSKSPLRSGILFMPYEYFLKYFIRVIFCTLTVENNYTSFSTVSKSLEGGHVYELDVSSAADYVFNLNIVTTIFDRWVGYKKLGMIAVCREKDSSFELINLDLFDTFVGFLKLYLKKGRYYIVCWVDNSPIESVLEGFKFRMYSKGSYEVNYKGADQSFSVLKASIANKFNDEDYMSQAVSLGINYPLKVAVVRNVTENEINVIVKAPFDFTFLGTKQKTKKQKLLVGEVLVCLATESSSADFENEIDVQTEVTTGKETFIEAGYDERALSIVTRENRKTEKTYYKY